MRHPTLVVVWSGERSTPWITERDTAQTERILMRLVDTSSLDSRLHQSSKRVLARPNDLSLSFPVVSASVAHTTRCSF